MANTPNDSGESSTEQSAAADGASGESERIEQPALAGDATSGARPPSSFDIRAQIGRPAVWGLVTLIIVTLAIQIWILFL